MEEEGWTLREVAERSGLSSQAVSTYRTGERLVTRPRKDTLRKLARGLQLDERIVFEAAGVVTGVEERALVALLRQMPTDEDRQALLRTARALVESARRRERDRLPSSGSTSVTG